MSRKQYSVETMGRQGRRVLVGWPHNRSRTASGRANRRVVIPEVAAAANRMPHRRGLGAKALDPMAATPLGRLHLRGRIGVPEYDAGTKYNEVVMRYRAVIDAPRESAQSIAGALEGRGGGSGEMPDRVAETRKREYMDAYAALEGAVGTAGARAVAHCVVGQRDVKEEEDALIAGLKALAKHFKFFRRRTY